MFHSVVACLLFFNVQSSQGLTARIKPNRTSFVFEFGIKPNITCESDCGNYNWMCTYKWVIDKNGGSDIYIDRNNSRIDKPLKENVTLLCYVKYNNIGIYSKRIKISIKERLLSTATPISDDKNDNDERTNITKEPEYAPRNTTIRSYGDIDDLQEGPGFFELSCDADCNPECDRYKIYHNGALLNESKDSRIKKDRRNAGRYQCAASNSVGNRFQNSTNSLDIDIKYGPKTTSVLRNHYQTISGDIIEKEDTSKTIPLRCSSICNPPCEVAWYKDGQLESRGNPVIEIARDRRVSGVYHCEASGVEGKVKSTQVNVTIQYPPEIVTINQGNGPFYTKRNGKPLHDITCKADCLPECTYTWHRERYPYPVWYTTGNSLFASKSLSHSGSYKFQCIASNNIGSSSFRKNSRWITVVVKDGPDNVTIIPSSPEIENKTFQLLCSASCYPVCQSYSWYYNGRWWDQGTQYLTFNYLSKDDSGNYWCQVTDDFGTTDSQLYEVNVQYGPKNVTIHYSSRYENLIEERDELYLTCNADCNPACSYQFYQNGKLLNYAYTRRAVYRNMSGRYTCSAKNSIVDTYRNSSNFEDINIKYKPMISFFVNRKILTAPSLLDLNFSVDSFPSSNVTIFHETKTLTFIPNVTGQLSFHVSVESCLDQGEYRVKAVNDAGYGDFTFIANVKCSPVIVRYSSLSQKGYQVGDSLSYKVDFMSNPEAEVSWTFIYWNNKEPKDLEKTLIQNQKEFTMVVINRLNFSNFGKYELELKNDVGKIKREFHIQGPPQSPTDLNVDCPRSAIISWRPGFDGGATQDFVIEYSDNSSYWLTHHPQSVVSVDKNFMSAQIHDIRPNTPYSFRIRAKNSFGVAASDTTVNCTWQNYDEMASFLNNRNALVGIGVLVLLLLIVFAVLVVLIKLKRRRESNNQDNSLRKQGNNSNEEDNASEIVENILYITADDAKEQVQAPVDTPVDTTQNGSDVYAVVEKKPKTDDRDDQPVYTDVCKADQKKKKPAIAAKPSKVKKDERPTVNKDGLIYVDLDLKDTPSTSTEAFVIHGADDRTQYVDIDFTRRADPPRDTDNEKSQNEKEKEKA